MRSCTHSLCILMLIRPSVHFVANACIMWSCLMQGQVVLHSTSGDKVTASAPASKLATGWVADTILEQAFKEDKTRPATKLGMARSRGGSRPP
jgi:hypothetical protein